MAAKFNFNRMWLLLQRYFIENRNREFFSWSIVIIIFMFARNSAEFFGIVIIFSGMGFCERFFREIHSPTTGLSYFMIPATQEEKTVISIFMTTVYYFGMMLIVYVIGNLVGTLLNNLLANFWFDLFSSKPLRWVLFENVENASGLNGIFSGESYIWRYFKIFIFSQAIFTFGSIYFSKSALFKTVLTLFAIGLVYGTILAFGLKGSFEQYSDSMNKIMEINGTVAVGSGNIFNTAAGSIIFYLLIPYLWVMSYFKLTEKEV